MNFINKIPVLFRAYDPGPFLWEMGVPSPLSHA
jgi:hypothetical protein